MAQLILFVVVLFTTIAISISTSSPFVDCGSTKATVATVTVSGCTEQPCILKKNTNVTLSVDFTITEDMTGGKIKAYGLIGGIPIPFVDVNPNPCSKSNLTCPLKNGQTYDYASMIFVRPMYPQIKVTVKWEMYDSNNNLVFCIVIPCEIED